MDLYGPTWSYLYIFWKFGASVFTFLEKYGPLWTTMVLYICMSLVIWLCTYLIPLQYGPLWPNMVLFIYFLEIWSLCFYIPRTTSPSMDNYGPICLYVFSNLALYISDSFTIWTSMA